MAEGSVEEENGEMLGPSGASMSLRVPTIPAHLSVKDEESDCTDTSSVGSPSPATTGADCTDLSMCANNRPQMAPHAQQDGGVAHHSDVKMAAQGHPLNGNMANLATLQNLASLHQTLPQVASLASHLSSMATMQTTTAGVANGPLNLSVNSSSAPSRPPCDVTTTMNAQPPVTSSLPHPAPPNHLLPPNQVPPMPQLILASGQLVQGIQGAQLLIPTSQGLATQTILTIPVNHINGNDQMVNLALNNGQMMQTSLASLQAMANQSTLINSAPPTTNGMPLLPPIGTPLPPATHPLLGQSQLYQPQATPLMTQATPPTSQTPPHRLAYPEAKPLYQSKASPQGGRSSAGASETSVKRSPSSLSPCNDSSTADLLIDSPNQPTINQTNSNVVDGINLDEIKDFAKAFKLRRLSLGLTQTQVGQALSVTEGPAYSQSAICSALASQMVAAAQQQAMFEKLDITPKSAQKIKPVLERWMKEAEERYKSGQNHLTDFIGIEPSKKRKRRTSFTPQALELLNAHFERNTHPSGTEITGLAHQLGYEREVIRIWFCNKRQALKNTVRMMSKGMV